MHHNLRRRPGRTELRRIFSLMMPLYIANLMNMGMGVADTVIAGRAGTESLASVALGSSVTAPIMIAVGSVLSVLSPMVSRYLGEGKERRVGLLLHRALILSTILTAAELIMLYGSSLIFPLITDSRETAADAARYVYYVMYAVPASLVMRVVQGCWEGYARTRPTMIVCLLGLLLNIPLNIAFVHGYRGFPALGGPGCGLATAIVHWLMAGALLGLLLLSMKHRRIALIMLTARRSSHRTGQRILRLGLPMGIASLCEMSYFRVVTLLIAPMGERMVSAQQIAINVSSVLYMFPLSLGVAVSIRASYLIGAHRAHTFRAMLRSVLRFMYGSALILMAGVIAARHAIPALYTTDPAVLSTASTLLVLCALYQISDATQAIMAGLLRGCHDTSVITRANLTCYWLLGFPLSYILIRTDLLCPALGPAGAWCSFIISLTAVAIILHRRFFATLNRIFPPVVPHSPTLPPP